MRALVCSGLGEGFGQVGLVELPAPEPGPGEVRVRVRAASLNFPDLLMLKGEYQYRPEPPFVSGMDLAGVVDAIGPGVERWTPGDRVAGGAKTGAFADFAVVGQDRLSAVPDAMTFAQAASYPAAYATAYVSLVERARLQAGETLLVLGASGGVGAAAVDVGRILGARVIAATGRPEKAAALKAYGADATLDASGAFRDRVKELTDGQGADVIFDPVGGQAFEEATRCIAFNGRLLVVGFASGDNTRQVRANLTLIKAFSVMGVRAGEYGRRFPERGKAVNEEIWRWAAEGRTRPLIHGAWPLEDWRPAFEAMRDRALVGKVVLTMG
jgi:NADPH2:quinone reductase